MPDSVALELPEEWEDIPLERDEFRAFVNERFGHIKETGLFERPDIRQFELLAALAYQAAQSSRVMIASSYFGVEAAPEEEEGDILLIASVIVSGLLRDEIGTDIPLRTELIVEAFSRGAPSDDRAARYAHIEPPSACTIAGLEAAKLVRLMTVEGQPGQEFKQFTQTYLVPVAEGDAIVVLQFSTPNFEFAREFSELFGRIAQTFRVFYPEDPTFLDEALVPDATE